MILPNNCCCGGCTVRVAIPIAQIVPNVDSALPAARGPCGSIPCGPFTRTELAALTCGSPYLTYDSLCVEALGTTTSQVYDKKGFRLAVGQKVFHGHRAWTWCADAACKTEDSRYLTLAISTAIVRHENVTGDGALETQAGAFDSTISVSRTSGEPTSSVCTNTPDPEAYCAALMAKTIGGLRYGCHDGGTTLEWYSPYPGGVNPCESLAYQMANDCVTWLNGGDPSGVGWTWPETTASVANDTELSFDLRVDGVGGEYRTFTFSAILSGEYKTTDVFDDAVAAAATWDISDNTQWNWRTDGYRTIAQIAAYDEDQTTSISPDSVCTGLTTNGFTGAIVGPVPYWVTPDGTNGASFSFTHITWEYYGGGWHQTLYGSENWIGGAEQTDHYIWPTATRWTEQYEGGDENHWPGYGVWWDGVQIHIQKGAEIKEIYPSYNPFGVAGDLRFMLDTGYGTDGVAHDTTALIDAIVSDDSITCTVPADIAVGDIVVRWGGSDSAAITANGTLRRVATIGGGGMTFDAVETDPDAPDYALAQATDLVVAAMNARRWSEVTQGTYGRVGRLRWQTAGKMPAPFGILGRLAVAVSAAWDGEKTTFVCATHQLINGDRIDLLDASYNVVASGGSTFGEATGTFGDYGITFGQDLIIRRIDATHFSVPMNVPATAVWARSTGAPSYLLNTTASLGNFVIKSTVSSIVSDALTFTVSNADAQIGGSCPVITCTPNADAPTDAYEIGFPSDCPMTLCGGRKWKEVRQYITDPYYQEPVADATVNMCPPLVEARTAVVAGAPALPAGCSFQVETGVTGSPGWDLGVARPNLITGPWNPCPE